LKIGDGATTPQRDAARARLRNDSHRKNPIRAAFVPDVEAR
jgi:hypothetical protein